MDSWPKNGCLNDNEKFSGSRQVPQRPDHGGHGNVWGMTMVQPIASGATSVSGAKESRGDASLKKLNKKTHPFNLGETWRFP